MLSAYLKRSANRFPLAIRAFSTAQMSPQDTFMAKIKNKNQTLEDLRDLLKSNQKKINIFTMAETMNRIAYIAKSNDESISRGDEDIQRYITMYRNNAKEVLGFIEETSAHDFHRIMISLPKTKAKSMAPFCLSKEECEMLEKKTMEVAEDLNDAQLCDLLIQLESFSYQPSKIIDELKTRTLNILTPKNITDSLSSLSNMKYTESFDIYEKFCEAAKVKAGQFKKGNFVSFLHEMAEIRFRNGFKEESNDIFIHFSDLYLETLKKQESINAADLVPLLRSTKRADVVNENTSDFAADHFIKSSEKLSAQMTITPLSLFAKDAHKKKYLRKVIKHIKSERIDLREFSNTLLCRLMISIAEFYPEELPPFYDFLGNMINAGAYTTYDINMMSSVFCNLVDHGYIIPGDSSSVTSIFYQLLSYEKEFLAPRYYIPLVAAMCHVEDPNLQNPYIPYFLSKLPEVTELQLGEIPMTKMFLIKKYLQLKGDRFSPEILEIVN